VNEVLADLEEKVRSAAEELRRLREENHELRAERERLAELEAAQPDPTAAAWQSERAEVQRRMERLVEHLEELLAS
jgi:FtsZ-binding cell division protein ZapB